MDSHNAQPVYFECYFGQKYHMAEFSNQLLSPSLNVWPKPSRNAESYNFFIKYLQACIINGMGIDISFPK